MHDQGTIDTGPLHSENVEDDYRVRNPFSLNRVVARFLEWTREMPGIVRGLYKVARPFRSSLIIILLFNISIAIWETAQPLILKFAIAWIAPSSSYITVVMVIVIPMLVIAAPHGIVLPFLRDLYTAWYFKPLLEKHISAVCLRSKTDTHEQRDELLGKRAPIAQEGRGAVIGLIEILLREPAFAFRGVMVLFLLYRTSPVLVIVVVIGMTLDLLITLLMDERLFRPYAFQKEFQFRIRSLEYKAFEESADPLDKQNAEDTCMKEWDNYINATRNAEMWRLTYQMPVRQTLSLILRITVMLIVASQVVQGTRKIDDYYWTVELAARANDPLFVVFGIQQYVMTSRESIRRLGQLCKIDFGIENPKQVL